MTHRSTDSSAYNRNSLNDFNSWGSVDTVSYGELTEKSAHLQLRKSKFGATAAICVSVLLCITLLLTGLLSREELVVLSEQTRVLQQEISELKEQQIKLKIRHAEMFPLEETEKYAVEVLGMQKPGPGQLCAVEIDQATQLLQSDTNNKRDILSLIREYFPG